MKFRLASSIAFLFFLSPLLAKLPSRAQMDLFYQEYIEEARSKMPGLSNAVRRHSFASQHFLLWDYLDKINSNSDLAAHFQSITALCVKNEMKRYIVFIKDPDRFTFFQPSNTDYNSFVYQANNLYNTVSAFVPDFYISVFFDSEPIWTSNAPLGNTPASPAPSGGYFPNILNMLNWAKAIIAQCPGVKEVAVDPEAGGASIGTQQILYNYMDNYKYINSMQSIKLGSTLGIDETNPTYANVATFPGNQQWGASIGNFPSSVPSWRSGNNSSILQSVYIQCYQTDIPSLFAAGANSYNANHNGIRAGSILNKILRNVPYLAGQGTLSSSKGSSSVSGQGTNFSTYSDAMLYVGGTKLGVVDSALSNTQLNLESGAAFSTSNSPFARTEITTGWASSSGVTQSMVNSIYWMFSLNYTNPFYFFGNWLLEDFMDFVSAFKAASMAGPTSPFGPGGSSLFFPLHNLVLYDANFLYNTVSGQTVYNGEVINWNVIP